MKVRLTSKGGFENITRFLKRDNASYQMSMLEECGKYGVELLRQETPRRSGATANSWEYRVEKNSKGVELYFVNNAHPELNVNLAKLIQLGYTTRTGGYVPPVNYIHPAMKQIYKKLGEALVRRFKL